MKKSGFTLWQLLGVLAILAVVAIIFFPVFAKPRGGHRHVTCASNEKMLGLAIMQYVQDNDENMPNIADAKNTNITWRSMIYPYAKANGIYQCPSRPTFPQSSDGIPRSYAANYTGSYSHDKKDWGQGVFAGAGSKPINFMHIRDPAMLIMLCEDWHNAEPDFNIDNLGTFNPNSDSLWAGHQSGSNYLFADSHYKYLKPLATKDFWHRNTSIPLSPGALKVLANAHKSNKD